MTTPTRRTELLAAIDRRLWRELGFADPEPDILPILPSLVVAWSDATCSQAERERIRSHTTSLPPHLRTWVIERLDQPPGPYFRYQVSHLLAFMVTVWEGGPSRNGLADWIEHGEEWARELIQDAGWMRRLFGGCHAEIRDLDALHRAIDDRDIVASDQIWAMARGAHADGEPRRGHVVLSDAVQAGQAIGIVIEGEDGARIAVGSYTTIVHDDDLDEGRVDAILRRGAHLREQERWAMLSEEVNARGRPLSRRQTDELRAGLTTALGGPFEEIASSELAYLEDALAVDARWMSWVPGRVEELAIGRDCVRRLTAPGTFLATRGHVKASVAQQHVPGPAGLGFRVLEIAGDGGGLRLASPVLLQEPPTRESVQWIARFLPQMCDPCRQLVLDEAERRWVAEVHTDMPDGPAATPEPLLAGRSLLVPPWIWFRAASALGVRYFAGKRKGA